MLGVRFSSPRGNVPSARREGAKSADPNAKTLPNTHLPIFRPKCCWGAAEGAKGDSLLVLPPLMGGDGLPGAGEDGRAFGLNVPL